MAVWSPEFRLITPTYLPTYLPTDPPNPPTHPLTHLPTLYNDDQVREGQADEVVVHGGVEP